MSNEEKLRQYLTKVTTELQQTKRRLASQVAREHEPIAIIGIGCRFPGGVRSPEDLWRLVSEGGDAVCEPPPDRGWGLDPQAARRLRGGFVHEADRFDPAFFGISDAEALAMDPQQRLLLKTAWEAFERAGIDPVAARGSRIGVYTGLQFCGYPMLLRAAPPDEVRDYLGVGNSPGAASGRLAYTLGFQGAAVSIDTGCTSSLVAVHVASQALRNGECELALAGGAAVMPIPDSIADFRRRGNLAPDGRSKSFSSLADGVSLGEGAGMLLLERLSDARRNGHPIQALVRGSAVNQDGATNGMSAPSALAQEKVIRQALADARLTPDQIDVVEGHGVGATLGDGIEAGSIIAVYGQRPAGSPALLGSVKSNIGHTQAVGSVAGVIKTVMAMRHQTVPKTMHIEQPTPHADWSAGTVRLVTEPEPWPAGERKRRAGVSCFTITGTNGHLILEEPPAAEPADREPRQVAAVAWPLSAKNPQALRDMAARLRDAVASGSLGFGHEQREHDWATALDVGYSLATTRSSFKHRAVVVGRTVAQFAAALDALADGRSASSAVEDAATVTQGVAHSGAKTAFFFTSGGGSASGEPSGSDEVSAITRDLAAAFPAFAEALEEVTEQLAAANVEGGATGADSAALFALELALAALTARFGIVPDLVSGSGLGQIAAAYAAGALSLEQACALFTASDALLGEGHGASEAERFASAFAKLSISPATVPVLSASTGMAVTDEQLRSADHWRAALSGSSKADFNPAAFQAAAGAGATAFLGLGADRGFADAARHALTTAGAPGRELIVVSMLSSASGDANAHAARSVLNAVGELFTHGVSVQWAAAFEAGAAQAVELPTYPFQERRFWLRPADPAAPPAPQVGAHPLLGRRLDLAGAAELRFAGEVIADRLGFVDGYRMHGASVLSAATLLDWTLTAARAAATADSEVNLAADAGWVLEDVAFGDLVALPDGRPTPLQTRVQYDQSGAGFSVSGFVHTGDWDRQVHARRVTRIADAADSGDDAPESLQQRTSQLAERDAEGFRRRLFEDGFELGPQTYALSRLWRGGSEAIGFIEFDETAADQTTNVAHPALLDGCMLLADALDTHAGCRRPACVERITVYGSLPPRLWCRATRRAGDAEADTATENVFDLDVRSQDGRLLARIEGLRREDVGVETLDAIAAAEPVRYETAWRPLPAATAIRTLGASEGSWLVHSTQPARTREWSAQLAQLGLPAVALLPVSKDDDADAIRRTLTELRDRGTSVGGLLCDGGSGSENGPDDPDSLWDEAHSVARHSSLLIEHFLEVFGAHDVQVIVTSTGAASVGSWDVPPEPAQAVLTGVAKTVVSEYPQIKCVQVDLDPRDAPPSVEQILGRAAALPGSGHLAVRGGGWYEAKLRTGEPTAAGRPSMAEAADEHAASFAAMRGDATYLVLGGLADRAGGVARWLAGQGARTIAVADHVAAVDSGALAAAERDFEALRCGGVRVDLIEAELTDRDALDQLIKRLAAELPPLRGVVLLPGADAESESDSAARLAGWLDQVGGEFEFLVLPGSVAALVAAPGASAEGRAVADEFIRALAARALAAGRDTVAVAWPPAVGSDSAARARLLGVGVHGIAVERVLAELAQATRYSVARLDLGRLSAAPERSFPYTLLTGGSAADGDDLIVGFAQKRMNGTNK